ncbi:homoprotocatechuate degradation operon regulator HpaR [Salipiger sp. IMCC34102]|uniref:homoprotocatechuate degradation operon regulator HpaR n=1 Tax=Salipiger sp. IMCC34102 TaxID=2510647 RepID=UPI00101D124E|nr:homoprotocatechuate degradation operon regulator HpaR [Salipiger sp. IMCC34102]RYH02639.1 homoprotocatechuate degradation operon regulator HpaR [Salipiger sp. IMCC34102]
MIDYFPPRDNALDSTRRSLPIALLRVREKVMEHFRPMLHQHGLTEQQWRVIRVLDETPGLDMGALAEAANILAPSLSRMTKTMQDRGLIEISRTPGDARRASLRLTADGTALIRAIAPESAAIRDRIEARIGSERIMALLDELDAILSDLDDEDAKKP